MEFLIIVGAMLMAINPALLEYQNLMTSAKATYIVIGVAAALYVLMYVFRAIALSVMAKRAGKKKLVWCAFVPFASSYLMGELAGDGRLGSLKIKKIGVFFMIAEILYFASMLSYYLPLLYGYASSMIVIAESDTGLFQQVSQEMPLWMYNMNRVGQVLEIIFSLIYTVVAVLLYIFFFRKYAPVSYIWMTVICVILPVVTPFILFAFRNRKPIDFDSYMRARTEAIRRARQQQYGNPYGPYGGPYNGPYNNGPYNGPYNNGPYNGPYGGPANGPYGGPYNNGPSYGAQNVQPPREPEDPFGEFSNGSSSGQDPFGEYGSENKKDDEEKKS